MGDCHTISLDLYNTVSYETDDWGGKLVFAELLTWLEAELVRNPIFGVPVLWMHFPESYDSEFGGSDGKESACGAGDPFSPWVRKIPWRKEWLPTPVFLSGEFHEQKSLAGYSLSTQRVGHNWVTNTHTDSFNKGFSNNYQNKHQNLLAGTVCGKPVVYAQSASSPQPSRDPKGTVCPLCLISGCQTVGFWKFVILLEKA